MKHHHHRPCRWLLRTALGLVLLLAAAAALGQGAYPIVDTNQQTFFDSSDTPLTEPPAAGEPFYGQDATYQGIPPACQDNGDGTVTDLVTGLMWMQAPDYSERWTFAEAQALADTLALAGYDDWRLPTIKELYSLVDFSGSTYDIPEGSEPYLPDAFHFQYPGPDSDLRPIDVQMASSTVYAGQSSFADPMIFGFNFADGRIKGYPDSRPNPSGEDGMFVVLAVRGAENQYGVNDFVDNGDGTVSDLATGLMWQQADDGATRNWEQALACAENLQLAGYDDWRLPNAKELQSIVDYTRAPDAEDPAAQGAALDTVFDVTSVESWFWSSTTHRDGPLTDGYGNGVYLCFGRGTGIINGDTVNVHGAGCQRSDPKGGDPEDWAGGFGPQGDEIRIYNYVRAVRDIGGAGAGPGEEPSLPDGVQLHPNRPNPFNPETVISFTLAEPSPVHLAVYDRLGREVATLLEGQAEAGRHSLPWNGSGLAAGAYFYRLQAGAQVRTATAILLK